MADWGIVKVDDSKCEYCGAPARWRCHWSANSMSFAYTCDFHAEGFNADDRYRHEPDIELKQSRLV